MPRSEKSRRRSIRHKGYDYSTPGSYFVTVCSHDRSLVFENPALRAIIDETWASLPTRYPSATLDVMVVMPNHVHFVVHLTDRAGASPAPTLGDIVRVLKSVVATEWLKHFRSQGPTASARIWQRNYYEHIVRNEAELDRIREYIANNPMLWRYDLDNPNRDLSAEYEKAWSWLERSI